MADPNSWQIVPNAVLDTEKQTDDAQAWGDKQRADIAQQWGDQQRLAVAPALPPVRDDWATGGGSPPAPFAQPAADSSSAAPSPGSAPSAAGDFSGPAAAGAGAGIPSAPAAGSGDSVPADAGLSPDAALPASFTTPASRPSQFGLGLSSADAMAFCGPTAAIAFAKTYGRNPTVQEARQLAQSVGWNPELGMAGVASEQALLGKMGVQTKLEPNVDWGHVASDAQNGNPVILDTPGHYYYVTGYDPKSGKFNVTTSGTDLRGGSEWMTASQINAMPQSHGSVRAALYADHPLASGPSQAESQPLPQAKDVAGQAFDWVRERAGEVKDAVTNAVGNALPTFNPPLDPQSPIAQQAAGNPQNPFEVKNQAVSGLADQIMPGEGPVPVVKGALTAALDPANLPGGIQNEVATLATKGAGKVLAPLAGPLVSKIGEVFDRISPPATALADTVEGGAARNDLPVASSNPFKLETEPGPGRTPITIDDAVNHVEGLQQQYAANDARIQEIENRIYGGTLPGMRGASGVQRPPWAAGITNDAMRQIAKDHGTNAEVPLWWEKVGLDTGSGEVRENVGQGGYRAGRSAQQTPADARRELAQLRAENEQIAEATNHAVQAGDDPSTTFYRVESAAAEPPPWEYNRPDAAAATEAANPAVESPQGGAAGSAANGSASGAENAPSSAGAPQETAARPSVISRPLFGRGGVPGGTGQRPTMPAPTQPEDVAETLARSQLQVLVKQARDAGFEDEQIAQIFKNKGASDEQIQSILHPPEAPTVPTSPRPVPADVMDRAHQAITRLDAGDESALDDLAQLDKQASGSGGAGVAPSAADSPPPPPGGPPAPPAGPTDVPPPTGPQPVQRAGISPNTIQAAHERIDRAIDPALPSNYDAHEQLDRMLADGAAPDEIARFLGGEVEGHKVGATSILRTVRTGSMAGGLTTEAKVAVSPIIQTAMRAPVAALKAIVTGNAADIPKGLQGGIAGLAEGAQDALQTVRYGTNYRAALTGGAEGGYGFRPGIDVMGKTAFQRAAGTAAIGLVRTHGAVSDISAGIGRGAALATGATPQAAAETGQQWALRSGNYGTIGKAVSDALEGIRQTNPAMDVVGQILMPFYRVGYNVFTQGVERSPLGLVGTGLDVARGKLGNGPYAAGADASHVTPAGDRLANNMFGVGLAAFGLAQAAQGNITGERPQGGSPKWSVRLAGQWVPIRALGPAGEALAQSATLYESARDSRGDVAKAATGSATEYVKHVMDETWLQNVGDLFHTIGDVGDLASSKSGVVRSATRDLQYRAGRLGKSFVPQETLGEQSAKYAGQLPTLPKAPARAPAPAPVR